MRKIASLLAVLVFFSAFAIAQTKTVTGRVTDQAGLPVPFASVKIKGGKSGSSADADGNFSIKVNPGATLVVSGTNFGDQEVVVGSSNEVTVQLTRKDVNLTEVIVTTALGVKKEARSTGYSSTVIPTASLTQAKPTNLANGLSGKVSGLQINTVNNGVQAATRIVLRGERSILGNNQALIVLDNVPVSADYIASINPDDVDNISILKGANAAALYGSNAANGVILISTKKGVRAKPSITYTNTTTIEKISNFPKFNTRFGAGSTEGDSLSAYTGFYGHIPYENQMYGSEYDGSNTALGYSKQFFRANGDPYDTTNQISYDYKNPAKEFFTTGVTVQNGLSYQAGTQNGSYYLSAQVANTTGTIPKDKANRYSVRLGSSTIYNKFSSSFSLGYARTDVNIAGNDYVQARPVYWNVLNTPGEIPIKNFRDLNAPFASEETFYNAYYPNPYWQIENSRVRSTKDDILGSIELGLKVLPWMNLTYRLGATARNFQEKTTVAGVTFSDYAIDIDGTLAGGTASSNPEGIRPKEGDKLNQSIILQSDFLINMEHKFVNNNLNVRLLLGNSINKSNYREVSTGYTGTGLNPLEIPDFYNVGNITAIPSVGETVTKVGTIGAFGSLQFAWKNFLFLEATGRNDWVSVLAPENRSFFYPGVNASFVFTDAIPFMKNISWLSFGKLFAAYTKVGNVNVNPYQLANTYGQGNGFPYGSLTGFGVGDRIANANLGPEFVASQEYGIELRGLKNRINLGVTYYNETVTDQTVPIQISSTSGYTSALQNVGNVTNSGWEFDLKLTPLVNLGPVKWNVGGNLALYHSKVNEIDPLLHQIFIGGYTVGGQASAGVYTIEGGPLRALQVTDWKRTADGKIIVDSATGRPSVATGLTNVGQSTPKVILGLNTSFEWKSLSLNILGEYRGGYVVYNNIGSAMAFTGSSAITTATGRQRFVYPNSVVLVNGKYVDNTSTVVNNVSNGQGWFASGYAGASTNFLTSGDFWKIREVSLNYAIPIKGNSVVKRASVGLVARNLFSFYSKDNIYADPEYSLFGTANTQGISNENLSPPTRVFGATVTVGF
ncbi:MAG TPA: SusC/RagA family TonB-linked outer membrane protein [Chryseolinea sp.]|nr:SusC/RagA family TonB-linked outer membrane protein [Chryseolinea sp.]